MIAALLAIHLAAADADDAGRLLDEGIRAYDNMELDVADGKLREARKSASGAQRARVELWLGVIHLERGNENAARNAFKAALQANPRITVPGSLSPKVHSMVEELRPAPARPRSRGAARETPRDPPRDAPRVTPKDAAPAPVVPAPTVIVAPRADVPAPAAESAPPAAMSAARSNAPADAPPVEAEPAAVGTSDGSPGVTVSPFLALGAGASVAAVLTLVGGVGFGLSAKGAEAAAEKEDSAKGATTHFGEAAGSALLANFLFVGSGLSAAAAAVGIGLWLHDELGEAAP